MKKRRLKRGVTRILAVCLAIPMVCTQLPAMAMDADQTRGAAFGMTAQAGAASSLATVTVVDDNDPSIVYDGWNLWTEGEDYTQHYSTTVGSTITYTFYGTGLELFCDKVSNGPFVSVSIDGEEDAADQYAPSKESDVLFYSKQGLERGEHTVVITLTDRHNPAAAPIGGGSLQATLTHLEVTDDPNAEELPPMPAEKTVTAVEDTDSGIAYSSEWQLWTEGDSYTQHYCRTPGATFTYSFVGTGIELYCDKVRNGPILYVAIDDEDYVEADQYTDGKITDASFYSRQDLKYGRHTVTVTFSDKANAAASSNLQATLTYLEVTADPDAVNTDVTYRRNYEDGETGMWEGAQAAVVADPDNPDNKVLELKDFTGKYAREASAPALENGTLSMRVKTLSTEDAMKRLGFAFRAEDAAGKANLLAENEGWRFFQPEGAESAEYKLLEKSGGLPAEEWLDVRLAFQGGQAELAVNGYRYGKVSIDGQSLTAGTFGFYNQAGATLLVDDVQFTNRMLAMGKPFELPADPDDGHVSVKEDYSLMTPDWSAGAQEEDSLKLELPAGGIAVNNNETMKTLANAVNTYQLRTDDKGRFGVVFNYASPEDYNAIYSVAPGEFRLMSAASGLDKVIASDSAALKPNTRYEVVVISLGGNYQLYVNAALLAQGEEKGLSAKPGTLGVYNAAQEPATMLVYASAMREVFYYFNDFEDAAQIGTWVGGSNSSASHVADGLINGSGELNVSLGRHENLINTDTPQIANGTYEFDLSIQKSADEFYKGCLGFLFRAPDASKYQSIYYENYNGGSSWWWLAQGYGQISSSKVLEEETVYHVRLEADGNTGRLYVNDELYVEVTNDQFSELIKGFFGFRQQYFANSIRVDNLKITEKVTLALSDREEVPVSIQSDALKVTMDEAFPRVLSYEKNGKTLPGGQQKAYGVKLNGALNYPVVTCEKTGESGLSYSLLFPTLGVTLKLRYAVQDSELRMDVTDVIETGSYKVQTIEFENSALISTASGDADASFANLRNPGGWYELEDFIYDDLTAIPENKAGRDYRSYGMVSSGGLAATINNSGIETFERLNSSVVKTKKGNVASLGDGLLTVRTPLDLQEGTKRLPWSVVLVCEDYNTDGEVNWQDAAAAHKTIRTEIKGMDTMKDNMMWIAMNFASQAQTTFPSSLDLGKTIYNYTDGFGQMIMHKGYAAEGHDDSHGDYAGHVNTRAGGADAFNAAIAEGKDYNIQYGIHVNVSEHMPDGLSFNEDVMFRPLSANWGWLDRAYWVDEEKDILSRNRYNNFKKLREELPELSFIYADIYGNSKWTADNLASELNSLGFILGTEFGGALEQGAAFTHWGRDNSYPNKGNTSEILRYFKNDLDVFTTDAMFNSSMMPRVATWSNKNNINEATEDFFNHNLPRKYMQHFDVLDIEDNYVTFSGGVRSEKTGSGNEGDNNVVTLTKNGRKLAEWTWWNLSPTVNTEASTITGDAVVFIPWYDEDSATQNPDDADKIYHWNAKGGTTTWQVPENWLDVGAADVYQLSGDNKTKIGTVAIANGEITLDAAAKTGYVLYPSGSEAPRVAGDFGSGTPIANPNFDATDLTGWTAETTGSAAASVEKNPSTWETYLQLTGDEGDSAGVSQTITGLTDGKRNSVYFFAELGDSTQLEATVEIDGITYRQTALPTDMRHYSFSKFWDTRYQKVRIAFDVPEGVDTAVLKVTASFGQNGARINLDEFRTWVNPSITPNESDPDYNGYILNEDFENVEQGYGVFAHAFGSGQYTHLAEYREEAGQFTNYVLDGNYSLKTNEFDRVGETLRTIPSEVHFEKNTEYEISFQYETGIADTYELSVKRPDGTTVYQHTFEATELNKAGKTVTARFATEDYDDYYVAISQLQNTDNAPAPEVVPEGEKMEYRYMSLDNVSVRKVLTIDSLAQAEVSTNCEEAPKLPATVTAAYSDGSQAEVTVTWDAVEEEQYAAPGSFTVSGSVAGTDQKAACLVTVTAGAVNKSTLKLVLDLANAHVAAGDVDKLIPTAQEQFHKALASAQSIYDNPDATQEQVDNAWKTLMNVIHALGFVPGDKTELINLVAEAKGITLDGYEDGAEKNAFTAALKAAEERIADEDAMKLDIDAAYKALEDAMGNLIPKPAAGDKTELKKVIDEANVKNGQLDKYVDDAAAKKAFADALNAANDMYAKDGATQDEIDGAKLGLLTAMAGLRLRADKSSLNDWLEELKAIDLTEYTTESAAVVRAVIARAEALAAQDLGEDRLGEIQAMIAEMENAKAQLEKAPTEPEDPENPDDSSKPDDTSKPDDSKPEEGNPSADETSSEGKDATDKVPTTGDRLPIVAFSVLALASAGAWLLSKRKK